MKVSRQVFILLVLALFFVGCASAPPQEPPPPPMEEAPPPPPPPEPEPEVEPAPLVERGFQGHPLDEPGSLLATRTVYFDFDEAIIKDEFRDLITAHAEYLANNANASISLEGHCDERGTREYNIGLGDRRSNAVRQMMLLQGAGPDQIQTISFGEERPVALGHDEESWALNRRGEIVYVTR
jgi:peptidoglycan-associated lipoprotein